MTLTFELDLVMVKLNQYSKYLRQMLFHSKVIVRSLDTPAHALLLKLMKRLIPKQLLNLLVSWLSGCYFYVKWYQAWSRMFRVDFGVRQGSVLSPYLFAIYMDDLAKMGQNIIVECLLFYMQMTFCYLHPPLENSSACYIFVNPN